jgi:triosephosphate isomerase
MNRPGSEQNFTENGMRPLIAGNWKMHGLKADLGEIETIALAVAGLSLDLDILVCPPATLIAQAAGIASGRVAIGGQDCHADISGHHTGDISAEMLRDAGASAVITGHSERRGDHGETDSLVLAKASAARRAGLLAIVCVGESEAQRARGDAHAICGAQVAASVPAGMTETELAIGYEPLWAIGSGRVPTSEEIARMHSHIRECLVARLGAPGKSVRILYGGSVNPADAREILALPGVGGALVGGASLKAKDFVAILASAPVVSTRAAAF